MNKYELEKEIENVRYRIKNAKSPYVKNDLVKYLRKLKKKWREMT
jgi:hypothetical protein